MSQQPPNSATMSKKYRDTIFISTHNSYSGGSRKSLQYQLDNHVRLLELDVHNKDGQYVIGHTWPGHEVDHGDGNPSGMLLEDWLKVIAGWSRGHERHLVVTVVLDLKDNVDLVLLNLMVDNVFGGKIWKGEEDVGDVGVESLRGRIVVVLSGNKNSRLRYAWDVGEDPAVDINEDGWVVEVHHSGGPASHRALWYWSGRRESDGRVKWLRHAKYDRGTDPAVAINNEGVIVEVHKSGTRNALFYHVGRLENNGNIVWGPSRKYDNGISPSVAFTDRNKDQLVERHKSSRGGVKWTWNGKLNKKNASDIDVAWSGNKKTNSNLFVKNKASNSGYSISVEIASGKLVYSKADGNKGRIRPEQVFHIEVQDEDDNDLGKEGLLFYATSSQNRDWIAQRRKAKKIVRQWNFETAHGTTPPANFPASNDPFSSSHQTQMNLYGAIRDTTI